MAFQDSAAVKALSAEWQRLKAGGAPETELNRIHQQAQALRAASGYTADASGTIYSALKAASETLTGTGPEELVQQAISDSAEAETVYVISDGSDYSPAAFRQKSTIDGESIAGYVVLGLIGLAVANKLLS